MSDQIIIIDNHQELQIIEHQYPNLKNVSLILLSGNFSPYQLENYSNRGYTYFDESITDDDAYQISENIHCLLWDWFLSDSGEDLSIINGCSLGSVFASSFEILLNTVFRYIIGLSKLVHKNHIIFYSSHTEDIFLDVIVHLQGEIGFNIEPVDTNNRIESATFGKRKQKMDAGSRKRDLEPIFNKVRWKELIAPFVLKYLQLDSKRGKRVLFMPGGKLDSYFDHVKKGDYSVGFRWILPINSIFDLIKMGTDRPLFYYFSPIGYTKYNNTEKIIQKLKDNLRKRINIIDPNLLIDVMDRHIFLYFHGALRYYFNALKTFQYFKPDLAVFSSDVYENYVIAAQAAKFLGILTAIIPHGIYIWGYNETKIGKFQIFDYGLAFGKVDVDTYQGSGMVEENIYITSFPYFERFFPTQNINKVEYRKALILAPDYMDMCPSEKISMELWFYKASIQLLDDLGIELIGIKTRHQFSFHNRGGEDTYLEIDGKSIPLIVGYTTLPQAIMKTDLVIGPASTALIETSLIGKDYYVFQHSRFHKYSNSISSSLFNYINASFSIKQLRDNILNKRTYKLGCSVYDFIDLEGVNSREDLFSKFESTIISLLHSTKGSRLESISLST